MVPPVKPSMISPTTSITSVDGNNNNNNNKANAGWDAALPFFSSWGMSSTTRNSAPPPLPTGSEGSLGGAAPPIVPDSLVEDPDFFGPMWDWLLPFSWGEETTSTATTALSSSSRHQSRPLRSLPPSKQARKTSSTTIPPGGHRETLSMSAAEKAAFTSQTVIDVDTEDGDGTGGGGGGTGTNSRWKRSRRPSEEALTASYLQTLGPMRMDFVSGSDDDDGNKGGGGLRFHSYNTQPAAATTNTRKLRRELVGYMLNLPITKQASIFVRVAESRLDLVRAMITGPAGTPYANGCFFFDFSLHDYPAQPPAAKLLTTGGGTVRFNPNLYNNGKVCLSLLGTWSGPGWVPNVSTLLQVLVSIQGLIMVEDPWYNEPAYEAQRGTLSAKKRSDSYSKNVRYNTLQWAIADPIQKVLDDLDGTGSSDGGGTGKTSFPYPEFSSVVANHFVQNADILETQMGEWVKQHPACKPHVTKIRTMLARLLTLHEDRKPAARPSMAESSSIPTKKQKIELIDLSGS